MTRKWAELGREREHDVEMTDRQDPRGARSDPALLRKGLTLGAMAIAARVIRRMLVSAGAAHVGMTAGRRRPAERDRREDAPLRDGERVLGFELGAVRANDVGDLEPWPPRMSRGRLHDRSAHVAQLVEWALRLGDEP